jgi:1-acyl-sn-glycerol-3-phosphate acyltransferase
MRVVWGLRSALFVLWMAATVVPWALLMLLLSIFVRGVKLYWPTMMWLRMAIWGAKHICGVNYRVKGMEHLPTAEQATQAVVLAAKHQSTWETFAFPTLMPHPLAYVFKRELLYVPFFGWAMGRLDMIHIDRSKRAEAWNKVAAQGKRLAAEGIWVIMFPEGTRIARGQRGNYKRRFASGHRHRRAHRAHRRELCGVLATQELPAAAGHHRHQRRPTHPQRGPRARRTDAPGGRLDRGRDAPA